MTLSDSGSTRSSDAVGGSIMPMMIRSLLLVHSNGFDFDICLWCCCKEILECSMNKANIRERSKFNLRHFSEFGNQASECAFIILKTTHQYPASTITDQCECEHEWQEAVN